MYNLNLLTDKDFYNQLTVNDVIKGGDIMEWTPYGFTAIDAESIYVGQIVKEVQEQLRQVDYKNAGRFFRKII